MEDEEVKKLDRGFAPMKLDTLSVDSLQEYLSDLQQEVDRVAGEIEKKRLFKIEANSFFKNTKIE